jgi:hypothetical protein
MLTYEVAQQRNASPIHESKVKEAENEGRRPCYKGVGLSAAGALRRKSSKSRKSRKSRKRRT